MRETQVWSLGQEDPLEKEMATHSSILAWRNPLDRGAWRATVHIVWERVGHVLMTEQHEASVTPLLSTLSHASQPFWRSVLAESTSEAQGGHALAKGGSKQVADLGAWLHNRTCCARLPLQLPLQSEAKQGCGPPEEEGQLLSQWS